jgi:hypothetical protein
MISGIKKTGQSPARFIRNVFIEFDLVQVLNQKPCHK